MWRDLHIEEEGWVMCVLLVVCMMVVKEKNLKEIEDFNYKRCRMFVIITWGEGIWNVYLNQCKILNK